MLRGILVLGLGAAAIGVTRLFASAIAEERKRREGLHHDDDASRWEAEGGTSLLPASGMAADSVG